jgi:hypothetical protein
MENALSKTISGFIDEITAENFENPAIFRI